MQFFLNWVLGEINLSLIDLSVYPCSIQFHPDYPKLVTTTTTTQQQQQHLPQPCQHQWDAHRKTWERRERENKFLWFIQRVVLMWDRVMAPKDLLCLWKSSHLVIVKFSFTIS